MAPYEAPYKAPYKAPYEARALYKALQGSTRLYNALYNALYKAVLALSVCHHHRRVGQPSTGLTDDSGSVLTENEPSASQ